jgi:uncharacterized protein HemX
MDAPEQVATHSPNDGSARADLRESAGSSSAQVVIGGKGVTWIVVVVAVLLALDIAAQVARFMQADAAAKASHDAETENRLLQYNMDFFRTHEFAALEVRVGVLDKMLDSTCKRGH